MMKQLFNRNLNLRETLRLQTSNQIQPKVQCHFNATPERLKT